MRERAASGTRQGGAEHDRVVSQAVVDHQILRTEQRSNGRHVCAVAADVDDRVLLLVVIRQGALELAMQRPLPGDEPAGGAGRAIIGNGGAGGRMDLGMAVQSEIVVGREVAVDASADAGPGAGACLVNAEERVGQADMLGRRALKLELLHPRQRAEISVLSERIGETIGTADRLPLGAHATRHDILKRPAAVAL